MTDLDRATRALREHGSRPADDVHAATLENLVAQLERAPVRRQRSRWIAVQLIAAVLVFAAWAGATGRLSRWTRGAPAPAVTSSEPPPNPPAPPLVETPAPPELAPAPSAPPRVKVPVAKPRGPIPTEPPPSALPTSPENLYAEAHELHFVRKDYGAAVAAWDRYLRAAPGGQFVPEARYERAIALIRLGRRDEAITALRPFADGEYGGYRRSEARALLQKLQDVSSP